MIRQPMLGQLMVRRLALGSPYSKPSTATAEDSLPHPASQCRSARLHLCQYSCGALPMQRGRRTSNRRRVDCGSVYARAERVRAPESCARRNSGESNAHSEPLAVTKVEAHIFQRNREGGSDMLPVRHIPGSGIPRKTGSKRNWQGQSQNISWTEPF